MVYLCIKLTKAQFMLHILIYRRIKSLDIQDTVNYNNEERKRIWGF